MSDRKVWVSAFDQLIRPVITNLANQKLYDSIPKDFHPDRKSYISLEAFGRTLSGMAPWLNNTNIKDSDEKKLQIEYQRMVIEAIGNAVDPDSPDFMNFTSDGQPLVDAAFLAHGLVRGAKFFKNNLPEDVKKNLISALKSTRNIIPPNINWNLFSSMVEGALKVLDADYDLLRVIYSIRLLDDWYKGDGFYGDGPHFNFDYYNSFVMQPMAVDLLDLFHEENEELERYRKVMLPRFTRYVAIQERMINPDGSFPVIGRSVTYRLGAFQGLAQAVLQERLPSQITAGQVRSGMNALLEKVWSSDGLFDDDSWLTPGIYGEQPDLAEPYISIGSLYLMTTFFLPLGLSENDHFWVDALADWTSRKIWNGQKVVADHSIF